MKKYVYSVRDRLVGFGAPILEDNDAVAMRNFERGLLQSCSESLGFAVDYDLYCIGEYTDTNALFEGRVPELIMRGSEVKEKYD